MGPVCSQWLESGVNSTFPVTPWPLIDAKVNGAAPHRRQDS